MGETVSTVLATRSVGIGNQRASLPEQHGALPNPSLLESGQFPARELAGVRCSRGA